MLGKLISALTSADQKGLLNGTPKGRYPPIVEIRRRPLVSRKRPVVSTISCEISGRFTLGSGH